MNGIQRKEFWETLCAVDGKNIQEDRKRLMEKMIMPKYLFRYRDVNTNTLEALRTNHLYFSSANYFDDPFDTFLHIDLEQIQREFESNFAEEKDVLHLAEAMKCLVASEGIKAPNGFAEIVTEPQKLKEIYNNGLTEAFLSYALELRNEIRKDTWSVCFSENGLNETLWLKYANQYKGFAFLYDLENIENYRCGKLEKCKACGIFTYGTPLYPMYYSDTPYDATRFARFVMGNVISQKLGLETPAFLRDLLGEVVWERERTTLIKKKCHEYDEEWRMITGCQMNPPIMMEWIPDGIILGLRMNQAEENLVISLAKQAGIKKIYKSVIDRQNRLDAYQIIEK